MKNNETIARVEIKDNIMTVVKEVVYTYAVEIDEEGNLKSTRLLEDEE